MRVVLVLGALSFGLVAAQKCEKGAKFTAEDCDKLDLSSRKVRGLKCCNKALGDMMQGVLDDATDPQKAAEDMQVKAEEEFGCDWECFVGDCSNFGYANYAVNPAHCMLSAKGELTAVCYRNK